MWHEARKQERKIRGMMVDYRKRAERRREYYEKIKADPAQFLQIHGRPAKINLDPAVAIAADSPANMMPWQGNRDLLIDRFDVRAHLDYIPEYKPSDEISSVLENDLWEERQTNYERYRTLVQNDFMGVSEEHCLYQIYLEEQFGPINKSGEEEKKKLSDKKATISYNYEDSTAPITSLPEDELDDDKYDSDIDLDVTVNVNEINEEQKKELNSLATIYGMELGDYVRLLRRDKDEAEALRLAKEQEEEKAMYSGRKSRRERRAFREKKLQGRKISPPSYAARESPTYDPYRRSRSTSRSRSRSPLNSGEITYITSFGGEGSEDEAGHIATGSTVVHGPKLPSHLRHRPPTGSHDHHRSRKSSSSSKSSHSSRTSSSRSRSRSYIHSRSRRLHYHYRRSRSRSRSRNRRYSSWTRRSRSRSHSRYRGRYRQHYSQRSASRSKPYKPRSKSRSRSRSLSSSSSKSHSVPHPQPVVNPVYKSRSQSKCSTKSDKSSPKEQVKPKSKSKSPEIQESLIPFERQSRSRSSDTIKSRSSSEERQLREMRRRRMQELEKKIKRGETSTSCNKAVIEAKEKLTPQEKLKRKMKVALNRQYKADKRAEQKKIEKQVQERQDREEELREMAIRMRRREREKRHRQQAMMQDTNLSPSRSRSFSPRRSLSVSPSHSPSRSRSRSVSRSPSPVYDRRDKSYRHRTDWRKKTY